MRRLTFLLAVLASVTATSSNNNCIVGCNCQEDVPIARKLKIVDCEIPLTITNETFAEISKKITRISLEHVNIVSIDKNAFVGFDDLEIVLIEDSSIGFIDSSAFDLPELGKISFTRTVFGKVPDLSTDYLEELLFIDCKLTEVPNLQELPSLTLLNLADNKITEIPEVAFTKLDSLGELILSNNSIVKLPPNIFDNNSELTTLTLDNNPLESFQLGTVSNLEFLSLKACKLTIFDRNLGQNLDLLNYLDLSHNQISLLPIDAFAGMKSLNYLDLSNNQLVELDDNIFSDNSKLDRIVLDNNNFKELPQFQTVSKVFQTYYFSCNNCTLKSLDNPFENMPGIVTVGLANNQIENINGVFTKINGLKQLELSNNSIKSVSTNAFSKDMNLELLNLSGNPLKPLDPIVFANIKGVKKLDSSNSGLTQLWANHNAVIPSLERLLIGKNNLDSLTVDDLKVTPNLKLIDLQENPLKCTQDLHDVIAWLIKNSVYPIEGANILKTHEALRLSDALSEDDFDPQASWKKLVIEKCNTDTIFDTIFKEEEIDEKTETATTDYNNINIDKYLEEDYEDYYEDEDTENEDESENYTDNDIPGKEEDSDFDVKVGGISYDNFGSSNLARATYILSLTSVFVITALLVLMVAVAVILCVLRRNKSFNAHNANLPRIKIPLWQSELKQKKHSGSVYKPLSEDLSGPRTPIINRYEFKQTPTVHNSIP